MINIPFNKPFIIGKELYYISQAVLGGHLAGNGAFTKKCQNWLEQHTGAARVLLTHSCTAALEMSALLCGVENDDEVIMPSYTFVSTANAFLLRGGRPKFVEIREDTLNLDEREVQAALSPKTKAVVPVHYAGVGCEMDAIVAAANARGVPVIEDAAQGVLATYQGRPLGTLGQLGCYSFHETKNFISGEGGALVVNDPALVERAEVIWEKGTNRSQFFRGEVDKYSWIDLGSSFLPSELVAAFLYAQLEHAKEITARRLQIFNRYLEGFQSLEGRGALQLPRIPKECRHNGHMFYVLTESVGQRTRLIEHLRERGIHSVFHYVPLHESPQGRRLGYARGDFPITESVSERLLRLPCHYELSHQEQDYIQASVEQFFA